MDFFNFIGLALIVALFVMYSKMSKEIKELKTYITYLMGKSKHSAQPNPPETAAPMTIAQPNPPETATPVTIAQPNPPETAAPMTANSAATTEDIDKTDPTEEPPQVLPTYSANAGQVYAHTAAPYAPYPANANQAYTHAYAPNPAYTNQAYAQAAAPMPHAPNVINKKMPATPNVHKLFFNNENWVGTSLFNRLGALLIVIGTIAIAAFEGFHPVLRTSILFALALFVIGLGEFMNRKKPTTVSMGISATGVALTYVAIAASFFALETIGMYAALIACIAATALGIYLATRYKAQVIGCFALIGGYLPIFALDPLNNPMMVGVMVYFIVLSIFSLILALNRKWSVMNYIGFVLTVIGASYLGFQADPVLALTYACFAFLLYTALPLVSTYRTKEDFSELDAWLIVLNTFISAVVIFIIANRLEIRNLHAILCFIFAIIYAGAAFWVKRVFSHKSIPTIFILTSIAFCVIFVPFYFEMRWFPVVWLAQAVVLACYGVLHRKKVAEYSGMSILVISAIALIANLMLENSSTTGNLITTIAGNNHATSWQFTFNYVFFTLGTLAILGCYFAKGRQWGGYEQAYKIIAFANLWIFALVMIFRYIPGRFDGAVVEHFVLNSWAIISFALAYLYRKIKLWMDGSTWVLSNIIHSAGILGLWISSLSLGMSRGDGDNTRLTFDLLAMFVGFALVMHYYLTEKKNGWTIAYKNINIISIWLAVLWCFGALISSFIGAQMILVAITFATAFAITRIPQIADDGTSIIAIVMHIAGLLWLWVFNHSPYQALVMMMEPGGMPQVAARYGNVGGMMFINALVQVIALIAINDLINRLKTRTNISSIKIVILSSYFLLVVTQTMMVQGNVAFNSAVISIMYALAAFAWIIIGFRLKNKPIRKAGLFLSIAAVAKLMIVDTWGLSAEMRIVSYISLGLILMIISFVYQRLSKREKN